MGAPNEVHTQHLYYRMTCVLTYMLVSLPGCSSLAGPPFLLVAVQAEVLNGRAAMLGLVALVAVESLTGGSALL